MNKHREKKQDKPNHEPQEVYPLVVEYTVYDQKAIVTRKFCTPPGDSTTDILMRLLYSDVEAGFSA